MRKVYDLQKLSKMVEIKNNKFFIYDPQQCCNIAQCTIGADNLINIEMLVVEPSKFTKVENFFKMLSDCVK